MVTEEKKQELLERLKNAVIQYDEDAAKEASNEVIALGMDANEAIFNGLVSGMEEVGRLFEAQEYFVPELLMSADALYAGLDILKPHVRQLDLGVKGSVVIGTVEGDVWASRQVHLSTTGHIQGDVSAIHLRVDDGGVMQGRVLTDTSSGDPANRG